MNATLATYSESKNYVFNAVRRYLSAMLERENAGITGINQTETQSGIAEFRAELIPESIVYVTLNEGVPVATAIGDGNFYIIQDDEKLNQFTLVTESGRYTAEIPTDAFEMYSDTEYAEYIRRVYDEKLLNKAIAMKEDEEKTLREALKAKMENFDALISTLQNIPNE